MLSTLLFVDKNGILVSFAFGEWFYIDGLREEPNGVVKFVAPRQKK